MITTAINHSEPLDLGRQGENLARTIDIDISAWRAEFGEGTVQLLHQRPGDSAPYPAAVEQTGDVVRWAITAADTARVGYGAAQLLFFAAGDVLAKQCIYRTYVSPSLGQSAGEPPEAQQPWVERVLAEASKVTGMTARAVELPAGAEPTADYADGVLTIGIPLGGDVSEAQVAQAVADYLAAHPIKESDPTVPDWAKQPDKPRYSADEVGAIAQTELQAAVDTALEQAKASGAFDGADGVGIQSVVQTTEATEDGGANVITVTKTDGTTSTFAVRNGSRGSVGPAGADGKSAYQYAQDGGYTGTQEEFAAKQAEDHIPVPATAEVGQTIVVKAVDESGKPTEWAAADVAGGNNNDYNYEKVIVLQEAVSEYILDKFDDGTPLALTSLEVISVTKNNTASTVEIRVLTDLPYTHSAGHILATTTGGYTGAEKWAYCWLEASIKNGECHAEFACKVNVTRYINFYDGVSGSLAKYIPAITFSTDETDFFSYKATKYTSVAVSVPAGAIESGSVIRIRGVRA